MKLKMFFLSAFFAIALTPSFQSCRMLQGVQIVSPYSAELVRDVNALTMDYDMFSVTIEQAADKGYETYAPDYNSMEVLSNSIAARLEAMPKSGAMLKQAELVRNVLLQYKNYHKEKVNLNDAEIRTNRVYFKDIVKPLLVSAMALK